MSRGGRDFAGMGVYRLMPVRAMMPGGSVVRRSGRKIALNLAT
jgi:hypothetical protein